MTSSKSELRTQILNQLPPASEYWVAYSGGVDSHVLLHLLATGGEPLPGPLGAVHVDHGLQHQSGDWSVHARDVCAALQLPCKLLEVDGRAGPGESPEAAARSARYRALAGWLPENAVLLTAQHRDDQGETLLLQLFRGAGPRGLAAMPAVMPFAHGQLVRPLLAHSRDEILEYARSHRLRWVEDPSNEDTRFDRNYVRRRLLPEIRQHWPGVSKTLARAAQLQADQAELAAALGSIDYTACGSERSDCLPCAPLLALDAARVRNLLRYWIALNALPLPSFAVLERIRTEMLPAADDARPLVHWPGAEVRRYRQRLHLMSPLPDVDTAQRLAWDLSKPLAPAGTAGCLSATRVSGAGVRLPAVARIEVGFRQGGEQLQPVGREGHHALKKLFQEQAVPDWERDRVPLIFSDGVLAAVAGVCTCEGFQAQAGETGYRLQWSRLPQNPLPNAPPDT